MPDFEEMRNAVIRALALDLNELTCSNDTDETTEQQTHAPVALLP